MNYHFVAYYGSGCCMVTYLWTMVKICSFRVYIETYTHIAKFTKATLQTVMT